MTAPEGSVMVPRSDAVACEYALTVPNSTTNQTAANGFIPGTSRMASSIVVKETELLPARTLHRARVASVVFATI
jgi:hypothetical protein